VVLADYHLGDGVDGLELLRRLQSSQKTPLSAALITADHSPEVALLARTAGYPLLRKPLRPAALRTLLGAFRLRLNRSAASDMRYSPV
jgi:CheY-like chemotaxis protein